MKMRNGARYLIDLEHPAILDQEVDTDDLPGAEPRHHVDGKIIEHATVEHQVSVDKHRRQRTGNGIARDHISREISFVENDLAVGGKIGGNDEERLPGVLRVDTGTSRVLDGLGHRLVGALALDQRHQWNEIIVAGDVALWMKQKSLVDGGGNPLRRQIEREAGPHDGADRCASDKIGFDARLLQCLDTSSVPPIATLMDDARFPSCLRSPWTVNV